MQPRIVEHISLTPNPRFAFSACLSRPKQQCLFPWKIPPHLFKKLVKACSHCGTMEQRFSIQFPTEAKFKQQKE